MSVATRLDLLDLRAESYIAQGDLARAAADAKAMLVLADRARTAAFKAQARNRLALVQIRRGEFRKALATANAALKAARQSKRVDLEAMSLFRLAEAQFRSRAHLDISVRNAARAAELFHSLGDSAGEGRALWALAAARSGQGRATESDEAANTALTRCRQAGDLYGAGNALNLLNFNDANLASALKLLTTALADFEAAGYVERQGVINTNLGIAYAHLGLYRRARRLFIKADQVYLRSGAIGSRATSLRELGEAEVAMGHLVEARHYLEEMAGLANAPGDPLTVNNLHIARGRLAMREGDAAAALREFDRAAKLARDLDHAAAQMTALTEIGRARLAQGKPRAALTSTRRAVALHRAHDLAALDGMVPQAVWWRHSEALHADKQGTAAREALEMAYQFLLKGSASLSDEGLRRNYLNKVDVHREIVRAWIRDAGRRRLSRERRVAHLAGEANLREPFERLVDTGLRLNELRSAAELHEFLIDEATELSGAERVLLVLEGPEGLRLAGSLVPRGEDATALLRDVTPALAEVRRTRVAILAHVPGGVDALEQRSRVVAPLIAQRQLLGFLYCDIDGAFGRFRESDRDLVGMLASQAAVALDNAQWSQGLEQKVAQRTEELQTSKAVIEQRANELAIINSIQEGMAAELDFQAIVDLVGDKLREVFRTGDIGIRWVDRAAGMAYYLYQYEHGARIFPSPSPVRPDSPVAKRMEAREPLVLGTQSESEALGIRNLPGTDASRSSVFVPIVGSDRVLGSIVMEDYERDHAFDESDGPAAQHGRGEHGRRPGECAPLRRDAAAAEGDRAARRRAGGDQFDSGRAWPPSSTSRRSSTWSATSFVKCSSTDDIGIRWYDANANLVHYALPIRTWRPAQPAALAAAPGRLVSHDRANARAARSGTPAPNSAALGLSTMPGTDQSLLGGAGSDPRQRPRSRRHLDGQLRARARLRRVGDTAAHDGGRQHGRGARERAPLRRDAAAAEGDRAARRRARGDQQHPGRDGGRARLPGDRRPRRRQAARGIQDRRHRHRLDGSETRTCCTPLYELRARRTAQSSAVRGEPRQAALSGKCSDTRQPVVVNTVAEACSLGV